jgi:hypothetical protein
MSRKTENAVVGIAKGIGITVGTLAAAAGWWITYSNLAIDHARPLKKAIDADLVRLRTEAAGDIACYESKAAQGRPLLLIHSVNAAASSY